MSNYNINQFHSGPGGAITAAQLNLVELYAELAQSNLQYSQQFIKVASQTGYAASIADQEAGNDQASATKCQAAQSTVDTVITGGSAIATPIMSRAETQQMGTDQTDLNKLENLKSQLQQHALRNPNLQLRDGSIADNPARDPIVENRINELKAGKHLTSDISGVSRTPNTSFAEELNEQAIPAINTHDEFTKIFDSVEAQISNKHEAINASSNSIQRKSTTLNQVTGVLNQITAASAQFGQASYQAKQGVDQGNAALANTSSSLASSALENQRSQNNTYFSLVASVLQALKAASSAVAA
jgi:hypothetical protein